MYTTSCAYPTASRLFPPPSTYQDFLGDQGNAQSFRFRASKPKVRGAWLWSRVVKGRDVEICMLQICVVICS